jgi:hypothetical protein
MSAILELKTSFFQYEQLKSKLAIRILALESFSQQIVTFIMQSLK